MGKVLNTPILESVSVLNNYKRKVDNYKSTKRLDSLIFLKTKSYARLEELATELDISVSTLRIWLNNYKAKGLEIYLQKDTRNRPYSIITQEIHEGLKQRLEDPGNLFNSFRDAQDWIEKTYGVKVNYKSLWSHITHKLKGSLKRPRKSNIKKDKEAEKAFLKTA